MKYYKVITIMSLSVLSLFFSSFDSFDYDKAWKKVDQLLEKGLPKSALKEVENIYEHAIDDKNISQQIKAVVFKTQLIFQTEELGLETVVSDLEKSTEQAQMPVRQILLSLSGEMVDQYFRSQYYTISQRTNLNNVDEKDIRTWTPTNFRSYIASKYIASIDPSLDDFPTSEFSDIIPNFKQADVSLRPSLYELLLDRSLTYFSNSSRQGMKPSFSFKIDNENYFSGVEDFIALQIPTQDTESKIYQALLLYQEGLRNQLAKGNQKVMADYDLKRLNFVNQQAEVFKKEDHFRKALKEAETYYKSPISHAFTLKIGEELNREKKYDEAIALFEKLLEDDANTYIKSQALRWISTIKTKTLSMQMDQVMPKNENFLVHLSYRNISAVHFKLLNAKKVEFSKFFSGNRQTQMANMDALPVLKTWKVDGLENGYAYSNTEEILDGLDDGKYILLASNEKDINSEKTAYVYSAFFVSSIAYSTYDMNGMKKVLVRDRVTGQPLKDATVEAFKKEYNRTSRTYDLNFLSRKSTNEKGFVTFNLSPNSSISYKIKYEDDYLDLEQIDYVSRQRKTDYSGHRIEVFTDRAIYRPGQTVYFKTLSLEMDKDGLPSIETNSTFTAVLKDVNGQEVEKLKLKSNNFGSASGSFILPVGRLTGQFFIQIQEGPAGTSHFFRVEEYKRPTFEVTLNEIEEEVKLDDTIRIEGIAKALSGAPISSGKVNYTVTRNTFYGWWSWYRRVPSQSTQIVQSEIIADAKGGFNFSFPALADNDLDPSKNPSYSYSIQVDVTDQAGETRSTNKSVAVSVFPYSYAWQLEEVMDISELGAINISPTTLEGKKVSAKGTLIISELQQPEKWLKPRKWQVPNNHIYKKDEFEKRIERIGYEQSRMSEYPIKQEILRLPVEYGENGLDYKFANVLTAGKVYKIELVSEEKYRDFNVTDTKYVAVTNFKVHSFPNLELLFLQGEKNQAEVGKPFSIALGTSDVDLTVYYQVIRDWTVVQEGMMDVSNFNDITYTPSEKDRGGFTIRLDYIKHNFSQSIVHNISLPWDNKDLKVELITTRDKVLPGSKEEWQIKVSGKGTDKAVAEMLATMYDASLDQFVVHNYGFNPYQSHFGNIPSRFYGFDQAISGSLNYQWSRTKSKSLPAPVIPRLQGLYLGYSPHYGIRVQKKLSGYNAKVRGTTAQPESMDGAAEPMAIEAAADDMVAVKVGDVTDSAVSSETGMEGKKGEISIRKNLDESVFFYPHLKTDSEGNVLISFTMNEALTSWKLLTFVHDKALRFGMMSHEVKTQKDVMIVANAPRFFREGDVMLFPATVTNLSDKAISATARLELIDPSTDDKLNDQFGLTETDQTVEVPVGESVGTFWKIAIPKEYKGMVKYRVVAEAGSHTDGEENTLPIVTNQTLVTETKVISLRKKEKKTFAFDALDRTKSETSVPFKYTLEYTSNPIWYAVQALPYLMEYPHNCTEQIFNRMYANTMASYIANQNPKVQAIFEQWKQLDSDALISNLEKNESLKSAILEETPWVRNAASETEQKKRIALLFDFNKMSHETQQALDELTNRQMANGAFSWFPGGRADVFITQNIVEGIAHLQHLGIISASDYGYQNILNNALIFLDEESKRRYDKIRSNIDRFGGKLEDDHLNYLSIHYLYIRSFFKDKQVSQNASEAYAYFMGQAEKYWLNKGLYSEAMIGLTLKRADNLKYKEIVASLKERSFYSEELGRYWNMGNGFNWYELPIESHAMMIEFFTETGDNADFVEEMKIWLLKNKQTNHWKTTKGTAAAIYSLLIQGEETGMVSWIEEDNVPNIKLGNTPLDISKNNVELGTGYFNKSWNANEITDDMSEITIENNNESIAWGAAYYQYFEDLDQVKEFRETPLKMKKKLYKEVKTDRGPELVEIDGQVTVEPGDRVITRIEIKVDRSMSYVHLKDMRGSGFEPENVLSGYRWQGGIGYYESTRDLASHFFISRLNKGTYVFEYPMRAVHRGNFSTGIASLQCMYAPEFTSHSDGGRVEVK
ncbi:MAG: alpha-2-macroglobulin family protein [Saprospiraceae bacterium]|nr:alpha-2-macroglobulin family protein [Saprospiraceae bacterium]